MPRASSPKAKATDILGWVNVKDFGATGNGSTDDRAAIQEAIDSVSTAGGVVFFPPGNFAITTAETGVCSFMWDTMTGTAATNLTAHTSNSLHTWTLQDAVNLVITDVNRVRVAASAGNARHYSSAVPPHADYDVCADLIFKTVNDSDGIMGVCGRMSTSADTFYMVRYSSASGTWDLFSRVAGSSVNIGTFAQTISVDQTVNVRLKMRGTTISVLLDDVERITATNSAVTAAGRGGLRGTGTATASNTTGPHVDNFRLYEPAGLVVPNDRVVALVGSGGVNTTVTIPTRITRLSGGGSIVSNEDEGPDGNWTRASLRDLCLNGGGTTGRILWFKRSGGNRIQRVRFTGQLSTDLVPGVEFARMWNSSIDACMFNAMGNGTTAPAVLWSDCPEDSPQGASSVVYVGGGTEFEKNNGQDVVLHGRASAYSTQGVTFVNCKIEGATGATYPALRFGNAYGNTWVGGILHQTSGAGAASHVVSQDSASAANSIANVQFTHLGSAGGTTYFIEQTQGLLSVTGCTFRNDVSQITSAWRIGSSVPVGGAQGAANTYLNTTQAKIWSDARTAPTGPIAEVTGDTRQVITLGVDVSAAGTAYKDITGLGFPVTSGYRYNFRFLIAFESTVVTNGAKFSINGPAVTKLAYKYHIPIGLTGATETWTQARTYDAATATTDVDTINVPLIAEIQGVVVPSASGTLIGRYGSEVGTDTIRILRGSTVEWSVVG